MIRINLHDYHDELRKIEIQKRVVKSLAVVVVAIFFIMVSWLIEQARLDSIKSETRKLESQVAALTSEVNLVKEMGAWRLLFRALNVCEKSNCLRSQLSAI